MGQNRTIAIGDIHGCRDALAALIDVIQPCRDDTIVTLGDYIDRGSNSRGTLDLLISVARSCNLVPLIGDHEEMMLDALKDVTSLKRWLNCGGVETLHSYGWTFGLPRRELSEWIVESHQTFLNDCRSYYESETHLFMHAGYIPELPMHQQPSQALLWRATNPRTAVQHCSGKIAVVGHTPQLSGNVLDLGFLLCIDTNCVRGGWLSALDVGSGTIWQTDRTGKHRVI